MDKAVQEILISTPKSWYHAFVAFLAIVMFSTMIASPICVFFSGMLLFLIFTHLIVNLPFLRPYYFDVNFSHSDANLLHARVKIIGFFSILAIFVSSILFIVSPVFAKLDSEIVPVYLDGFTLMTCIAISVSLFSIAIGLLTLMTQRCDRNVGAIVTVGLVSTAFFLLIPLTMSPELNIRFGFSAFATSILLLILIIIIFLLTIRRLEIHIKTR